MAVAHPARAVPAPKSIAGATLRPAVIDTHCHLTFPDFGADRFPGGVGGVLAEAADRAVTGCITVSTTVPDAHAALGVARAHDRVWCSAGVHPLYADRGPHDWAALARVAADPRCVAWGELGLDNHYPTPARAVQDRVLEEHLAQIESSAKAGLVRPVIIHCREAYADLVPVLRRSSIEASRVVFHCFTGTPADVRLVLDYGAWVSFTGVVTYRNASAVREAAALVPADRIMVETDAPFLSPEPHRSVRPCRPWMVCVTARRLAEVRATAWDDFHRQLNDNTARFFGIPAA